MCYTGKMNVMTNGPDKTIHLALRIDPILADRIDAWRVVHMPLQPKAEAVRRLLDEALAAYDSPEEQRKK
jgi:hypothetical protein